MVSFVTSGERMPFEMLTEIRRLVVQGICGLRRIFSAFFITKPQGTGMGLRISRSIAESHAGRLWAAANSPRGASFYLTLPITAEAGD